MAKDEMSEEDKKKLEEWASKQEDVDAAIAVVEEKKGEKK